MNFIKKNNKILILLFYFFAIPFQLRADTNAPIEGASNQGKIINPLATTNTLPDFIAKILNDAVKVGIPIVALAIIYCGFLFVSARGNSEKLTKAKEALLWTLVGAAILLGGLTIATIITSTINAL